MLQKVKSIFIKFWFNSHSKKILNYICWTNFKLKLYNFFIGQYVFFYNLESFFVFIRTLLLLHTISCHDYSSISIFCFLIFFVLHLIFYHSLSYNSQQFLNLPSYPASSWWVLFCFRHFFHSIINFFNIIISFFFFFIFELLLCSSQYSSWHNFLLF